MYFVKIFSPPCLLLFFSRSFLLFKGVEGVLFFCQASQRMKMRCKRMRKGRKKENGKMKEELVVSTKECLADMTNSDRGSPTLPFSYLSHQSSLCILSLDPETTRSPYFTQEPAFLSWERGHCTPSKTGREDQKRATLFVQILHLMNCRTRSTTKESENRLKSNVIHTVE